MYAIASMKAVMLLTVLGFMPGALRAVSLVNGDFADDAGWERQTRFQGRITVVSGESARSAGRSLRLEAGRATHPVHVRQTVSDLPAGIYELTVWAHGTGRLRLTVEGGGDRLFDLEDGGDWQLYGLVFEQREQRDVVIGFSVPGGNVVVDDAALTPADADLQARWQRQQDALFQLHYIPDGYSAQRPAPAAAARTDARQHTPVPRTDRTVYYDPLYDTAWNREPDGLADWFARRGFTVRNAAETTAWMDERIADGAFSSTLVMVMDVVPESLLEMDPETETTRLRRYLDAGGRVVWTGNTALYVKQGKTGPSRVVNAMGDVLGVGEGRTKWRQESGTLTAAGRAWGLESGGSMNRAVDADQVTLVLAGDASIGGAGVWLRTSHAQYPLSGFIASVFALTPTNETALRDVYRMAVFVGDPVTIPEPEEDPPPPPSWSADLIAGVGGVPRRALVRSEHLDLHATLRAPDARTDEIAGSIEILASNWTLREFDLAAMGVEPDMPLEPGDVVVRFPATFRFDAGAEARSVPIRLNMRDVAVGDYVVRLSVPVEGAAQPITAAEGVAVRPANRGGDRVALGIRANVPENPYRRHAFLKEIRELGFDLEIGIRPHQHRSRIWDDILLNDMRFVGHWTPVETLVEHVVWPDGSLMPNPWGGGRPGIPGVAGRTARENVYQAAATTVAPIVAAHPAFSRVFVVNDDFSARVGHDYNPVNQAEFRHRTGLDAPSVPEADDMPEGIVPDGDPWILWQLFLAGVHGRFNTALMRGLEAGCPGARVWPVPGSALWPLYNFGMGRRGGQYPPLNFGAREGLNTLGYYTYLSYWAPTMFYLYWNEVARMENRDLDLWVMPTAGQDERHYIRNAKHILLAGGADGIVYFYYPWLGEEGRKEHAEFGRLLERHGALLKALRPTPRRVAMLLPLSEAAYTGNYPLNQGYVFNNLVLAGLDVEPISEGEIAGSQHDLILLSNVKRLRQSAATALEDYIGRGGRVILDAASTVAIRGAEPLGFPLRTGYFPDVTDPSEPMAADHVAKLRQRFQEWVVSGWNSPRDTVAVRRFQSPDGVAYAYAVEADTREEYRTYRRNVYEVRVQRREPELDDEALDAFLAEHGMGTYQRDTVLPVEFPASDLPAGGRVVDMFSGRVLEPVPVAGDRLRVDAPAQRFGGVLLALLPAAAANMRIDVPARVRRNSVLDIAVALADADGKPVPGAHSVRVRVERPDGVIEPELSGYYCAQGGKLSLPGFVFAANHPRGTWRIRFEMVAEGLVAEADFRLED